MEISLPGSLSKRRTVYARRDGIEAWVLKDYQPETLTEGWEGKEGRRKKTFSPEPTFDECQDRCFLFPPCEKFFFSA